MVSVMSVGHIVTSVVSHSEVLHYSSHLFSQTGKALVLTIFQDPEHQLDNIQNVFYDMLLTVTNSYETF